MKKAGWIILGVCLGLVFCICAGLFLAGRVASSLFIRRVDSSLFEDGESFNSSTKGYKDLKNPYSADGKYSVEMKSLKELEIDWISGSVAIELTDENVIRIQEKSDRAIKEADALRYGISGNKLRIQACKNNHVLTKKGRFPQKELVVSLPRSLAASMTKLDIDTVSAAVTTSDLQLEELDVNTVSGQVEILDIAAKEAKFDTVSGDVTLRDCSFDSLRMDGVSALLSMTGDVKKVKTSSISGSVQLWLDSSSEIRVSTMSGHVALTFYRMPKELQVDTTSALTSIYLPEDASCTVKLDSMSGKLLRNMQEVGSKQLVLGEGEARFDIDSMSGDVWIQPIPVKAR